MKIFIDDERMPLPAEDGQWIIVRDGQQAINLIKANRFFITAISFDNDLGGPVEGADVLKAIVGNIFEDALDLPRLQEIRVHSANNIQARTIHNLTSDAIRDGKLSPGIEVRMMPATEYAYPLLCDYEKDFS
jgi:hypothetical protein